MKLKIISIAIIASTYGHSTTCNMYKSELKASISTQYQWFLANNKPTQDLEKAILQWEKFASLDPAPIVQAVCSKLIPLMFDTPIQKILAGQSCKKVMTALWPAIFMQMNYETGSFLSNLAKANNFAGLNKNSFELRPLAKDLKLNYQSMFWNDNGNKRSMLTFANEDHGVQAILGFYLMPRLLTEDEQPGRLLYATCLHNFSINIADKVSLNVNHYKDFLNCSGKIWAESGVDGDYGNKAFGDKDKKYTFFRNYQIACQKKK